MRCKTCDYSLWGIRDRICPECGGAFVPSEFEFARSAVAFHCPHCNQAYYGTSAKGHLTPRTFACSSCHHEIDMDEMVLTPGEGVREDATLMHGKNPWESRKGFGFFGGWLRTIWMSMFSPVKLIRMSGSPPRVGSALWFATFTLIMFTVVSYGSLILFSWVVGGGGMGGVGGAAMFGAMMFGALLFSLVLTGISAVIAVAIWGLLTHGLLMLSGGAPRGIGRTMQAVSYGAGANIATAIPVFGFYLGMVTWIWWGISSGLMLAETHRVSRTRALIATLTPPAICALAFVGFVIWVVSAGFGALGGGRLSGYSETDLVNDALIVRMQAGDMDHAVEMIADGDLEAIDLVLADTLTFSEDSLIAGRPLDDFETLTAIERSRVIQAAVDELPDDVVAYRMGDFVFTHQGVDVNAPNAQNLWLVVAWPDPDVNASPGSNEFIMVGLAYGYVSPIFVSTFAAELATQNKMRETHGLPPIPHPSTVLHGQPASAPVAEDDP